MIELLIAKLPGKPGDLLRKYGNAIGMVIKYSYAVLVTALAAYGMQEVRYFIIGLIELFAIFMVTDALIEKHPRIAAFLNRALFIAYHIETLFLYFSCSYVTLIMMTNVESLDDLSDKFPMYIFWFVLLFLATIMPMGKVGRWKSHTGMSFVSLALVGELVLTWSFGSGYSPFWAYYSLLDQKFSDMKLDKAVREVPVEEAETAFYKTEVADEIKKPASLPDQPNVILIFTEGLSESLLETDYDLMPDVKAWQDKSLSFDNYYNCSFATYRGLIDQLYSGHQHNNFDTSSLPSLQSLMKEAGYTTAFVNAEPKNEDFTAYLESFGFDSLVTDESLAVESARSISDKNTYDLLFKTAEDLHKQGQPFLTTVYTFGTHLNLPSPDETYGDGSSAYLNKYWNLNCQFASFMAKFEASDMAEDTIVIFTADHSTFTDNDFHRTFSSSGRVCTDLDTVPFFIYYKGVEARSIDAGGRNSLDLAPTVLDLLDISGENAFLGTSLFGESASSYETTFYDPTYILSTKGGAVTDLTAEEKNTFLDGLGQYFALKAAS